MVENVWGKERIARCKCDFVAGTCSNIECPHSLNSKETQSFWVEGWALSKYSIDSYKKSNIGGLIKKIKYSRSESYSLEDRILDSKIIANEIIGLIKWLYDPKNLPFDICVCPPPHKVKPLDLPDFICEAVSGGTIKYLSKSIIERTPLSTVMNLPKEERSEKLKDNFIFDCPPNVFPRKGVLIIDDVFQTGSTLKGVSRAIRAQFPGIPCFVITAAYIGHMGRISAL